MPRTLGRFAGSRAGVWAIKHVDAPLDLWLYRRTGGRFVSTGRPLAPMILLTTRGWRTGKPRTTPVFHLRDGDHIVVCNARPAGERDNPWPRNLRAHPTAMVERGRERQTCNAREATRREIAGYWPDLVAMWPAYDRHYRATGDRSIFILDWSGWG